MTTTHSDAVRERSVTLPLELDASDTSEVVGGREKARLVQDSLVTSREQDGDVVFGESVSAFGQSGEERAVFRSAAVKS